MIRIYTCEQVSEQLKEIGIPVSGKTILHWLETGKITASVLHETKKTSVQYFTDSDIEKIIESKTPKRKEQVKITSSVSSIQQKTTAKTAQNQPHLQQRFSSRESEFSLDNTL